MTKEVKGTRHPKPSQKGAYLKKKIPVLTEAQISHMADRFCAWPLPDPWYPDGGITFEPLMNKGTPREMKRDPSGTNLFSKQQAEEMIRYMIEGLSE